MRRAYLGLGTRFMSTRARGVLPGQDLQNLRKTVRGMDREMYQCSNFMKPQAQECFLVLRALNAELAKIADATQGNVHTAAIRFRFWKDLIGTCYQSEEEIEQAKQKAGDATAPHLSHPYIGHLRKLIKAHKLTKRWLDKIVDARDRDVMSEVRYDTLHDLEQYCEHTQSSMLYLTMESLGVQHHTSELAASYVGRALGLTTLLRGFGHHTVNNQVYIPNALLHKHNITAKDLLGVMQPLLVRENNRGASSAETKDLNDEESSAQQKSREEVASSAGLPREAKMTQTPRRVDKFSEEEQQRIRTAVKDCLFDTAVLANAYIEDARAMTVDVKPEATSALLPAIPCHLWLRRFEHVGFDITSPGLYQQQDMRLMWNLFRHTWNNSF